MEEKKEKLLKMLFAVAKGKIARADFFKNVH